MLQGTASARRAQHTFDWPCGRIIPKNFHFCQKLPDVCLVYRQVQCSLKETSPLSGEVE